MCERGHFLVWLFQNLNKNTKTRKKKKKNAGGVLSHVYLYIRTDGGRDLLPLQGAEVAARPVHQRVGQGGEDAGVAEGGAEGLHGLCVCVCVFLVGCV